MKKFGPVKLIDSTTISMCLKYFSWALFRKNKAGVKIHTKFDLTKGIPQLFIVTNAEEHDRTQMDALMNEKYCIYVFDKGYIDYKKFDEFTKAEKSFITRLKDNAVTKEIEFLKITHSEDKLLSKDIKLISDKLMKLGNIYTYQTKKCYRVIKLIDDKGKELTFVTNILDLSTEEIAWLYKKRWEIELFFKWIKQNLKFKKLIGHTFNAVMIQIITGIMTFIMLKLVHESCNKAYGLIKIKRKIRECISQMIIMNLFTWYHWLKFS
jgi:IS4 transposase